MKVVADTNVLLRTVVHDDELQATAAESLLQRAEIVVVTLPCFCELVWVLRSVYRLAQPEVAEVLRAFLEVRSISTDRRAVAAGLALLDAGGDFADGVIAYEGYRLGGETLVSFDRKAVKLLQAQGKAAQLLS